MAISDWSTTAADNDDADIANGIDWRELMNPGQVNNSARAMMAGIKAWYDQTQAAKSGAVFIQSQTISSPVATVDFTAGLDDTYDHYMIVFDAVKPATDDSYLMMRVGTGAGPTWLATGYEYGGRVLGSANSGDIGSIVDSITHSIVMSLTSTGNKVGNAGGRHIRGAVEFSNPETSDYSLFDYRTVYVRPGGTAASIVGFGQRGASAITGVRFMFNTGNIASGSFRLYGLRKS